MVAKQTDAAWPERLDERSQLWSSFQGFKRRLVEARYQAWVTTTSMQTSVMWAHVAVLMMFVVCARNLEQHWHSSALTNGPLVHSAGEVFAAAIFHYDRSLFQRWRTWIWLGGAMGRLISYLLATYGWRFSASNERSLGSIPALTSVYVLVAALEPLPVPLVLLSAMGLLLVLPGFLVSLRVEDSMLDALPRTILVAAAYIGCSLLRDWHSRGVWLRQQAPEAAAALMQPPGASLKGRSMPAVHKLACGGAGGRDATDVGNMRSTGRDGKTQRQDVQLSGAAASCNTIGEAQSDLSQRSEQGHGDAPLPGLAAGRSHEAKVIPLLAAVKDINVRYRARRSVSTRTTRVRVKLTGGLSLRDLPADYAGLCAKHLAADGQVVVSIAARDGCIEILFDVVSLPSDLANDHEDIISRSVSGQQSSGSTSSLGVHDVLRLLNKMKLPFDRNQVTVQLEPSGVVAEFQHDPSGGFTVVSQAQRSNRGECQPAAFGSSKTLMWTVAPVAVTTSGDGSCLDLACKLITNLESNLVMPSSVLTRLHGSFLEGTPLRGDASGDGRSFMVQVPPGLCPCNALLQLNVRAPGESTNGLLSGTSCNVLLLRDTAVAVELNANVQPRMVEALDMNDVGALEALQSFLYDIGVWLQFADSVLDGSFTLPHTSCKQRADYMTLMTETGEDVHAYAEEQCWVHTAAAVAQSLEAVASVAATAASATEDVSPATMAWEQLDRGAADTPLPAQHALIQRATNDGVPAASVGHMKCAASSSARMRQWVDQPEDRSSQAALPARMPWHVVLWGCSDPALESRLGDSLHTSRTHYLAFFAAFSAVTCVVELCRGFREPGIAMHGLMLLPWCSVSVGTYLLHIWRPTLYNSTAYRELWPWLYWLCTEWTTVWMAAGWPVREGLADKLRTWQCTVLHLGHLAMPTLFKLKRFPSAAVQAAASSTLIAWLRVHFGTFSSISSLCSQEMLTCSVIVLYMAVREYHTRKKLAELAATALESKKHA